MQDGPGPSEAKVFRAHAPPQGACENLVCALETVGQDSRSGEGQLGETVFRGLAGAEQAQHHKGAEEVHRGGHPRGGKDWRGWEINTEVIKDFNMAVFPERLSCYALGFLGGHGTRQTDGSKSRAMGELSRSSAESTRSRISKFRLMRNT